MDQLPIWFLLGVPAVCALFGVITVVWSKRAADDFERRYGKRG